MLSALRLVAANGISADIQMLPSLARSRIRHMGGCVGLSHGTAWGLCGGNPPVRDEIVHESERTRVTRLFFPGGTVVRKEPLGPGGPQRLRHELAILERLRGVRGVAQLVDAPRYPASIVLEDVGGTTLAGLAKPLPVDELIGLALDVARAVAGMHRLGVMHRDITPANILIRGGGGSPYLVDFALATSFAEIRPEFTHYNEIVGTLERGAGADRSYRPGGGSACRSVRVGCDVV